MPKIDFHCHLFPPAMRQDRQPYFSGEPEFKLLYESANAKLVGADNLIATLDRAGIERAVVFGFPWRNLDHARRHNDYILEVTQRHPERLTGLGCFNCLDARAPEEARRCLDSGLAGIGELAFYEGGLGRQAQDSLQPIMDLCRERRVPVMLHTNEPVGHQYPGKSPNTLAQIYDLVKRFAENQLVLAHWGAGLFFYLTLKKEVRQTLANVYFDTAASPYLYDPMIYQYAKQLAGIDRILMGTDYPLLPPERYFKEMQTAGLTPAETDLVCGGNAARLLGL